MNLSDNGILIVLISIALVLDIMLVWSAVSSYYHRRTYFSMAHCICPIITFFWCVTVLAYTAYIYFKDSITNVLDFAIFMPFWIVIIYFIILILHWKLFLLRVVISKLTNHLVLMLKISVIISTLAFFAQMALYVLFLVTTDKEKAVNYANRVSLILGVHIIQELWGLSLVISAIKRFVANIGNLKITPAIGSDNY
jgi:hypothetical protein